MELRQKLFIANQWYSDQYSLLDSGDGRKLERFGTQTVIRPDPQAFWPADRPVDRWQADAEFDAKSG
ncbi:MAG: class I SAM-dependent rRNA methyltransferase, partial [Pseudomonadota bacterium]